MNKSVNIVWHHATVTRARREELNGHKSVVLWFTGLSGSGKSTLSHAVEERLYQMDCRTFVLDGDNVRHGLCGDLGFSEPEKSENIRRASELTKLFVEAGIITLAAFISPFQRDRARARSLFPHGDFLEIYCDCSVQVCESRDVKGVYKRARAGEIACFTGVSSAYEVPTAAELVVDTARLPLEECVELVLGLLRERGVIYEKKV